MRLPAREQHAWVAVGYSASNTSLTLKLFLSRLDELAAPNLKP
jgi:hypothetical protein